MVLVYSDYGINDNQKEYARIKGDKSDIFFFRAVFSECKFYKHENAYVLAGYFDLLSGISRAYKNDPINPGLIELPIYGSEYELREKNQNTKQYESNKYQPSTNEKILYDYIQENESKLIQAGRALKGEITLASNESLVAFCPDEAFRRERVLEQFKVETIEASGRYPDWTPPKAYRNNGGGNYAPKGMTAEERIVLLKTEMGKAIKDTAYSQDHEKLSLSAFIHKIIEENEDNETFLTAYFNMLDSVTR